jgi:carboxyl-terminal processing protease
MFTPFRPLAAAVLFLGFAVQPAFAAKTPDAATAPASTSSTYELLNLFGEVFDRVRSDYVEPVSDDKLIESALNGMLTSLDPHSSYLTEKGFGDMKVQTKGEFGGLGIEVTMENGLVKVVSPIDDTPAARAGVKSGDFISEIDGTPVMGLTLSDAVDKMRGAAGGSIKISILREGLKEPLVLNMKRDVIKIQSVRSRSEDDVAYLRITSFSENTADALKAGFEKEKKTIGSKLKGVVLDLRNNPGGLLDQAIAVSDAFLDHGEIVSTRSRKPEDSRRYSATSGDMTDGLPMVVLINEGSASASEIVAGALKDHKRAVIMGVKSFGKGSVQTVIPIDGHGALRLTTARYYTPSGVSIQATGIIPDIVVEQAKLEALKAGSTAFSEAALPGHLTNDQAGADAEAKPDKKDEKKDEKPDDDSKDKKSGKPDAKDKKAASDYQLSRALDLIRAVSIYQRTQGDNGATTATPTAAEPSPLAPPAASPLKKKK